MNIFLLRGFSGGLLAFTAKYCMKLLSMSVFSVLTRLSVFVTIIMSRIFLKTEINFIIICLAVSAFLGVILNIEPGLLGISESKEEHRLFEGTKEEWFGIFLTSIFVLGMGLIRVALAYITQELKMSASQNLFYFHIGLLHWSVLMSFNNPFVFKSSEIPNYVLVTLAGGLYQYFVVEATRLEENPSIVMMIQNLVVVYGYVFDQLVFGKDVQFLNFLGGIIVVISSVFALFYK